jgi:hypothetical protein
VVLGLQDKSAVERRPSAGAADAAAAARSVSLQKMLVEEHDGSVLYRSEYNPYFHTDSRLFPATEFLVEVLQHLPDPGSRLIRRYGLYSSRSRGTPSPAAALARREGGPASPTLPVWLQRGGRRTTRSSLLCASAHSPRTRWIILCRLRSPVPPGPDCSQRCTKLTS